MTTNITLDEIRALIHTEMKKLLQGNTSVTVNSQPSRNLLPPQLMARMTHPEAFDKAVTEGLIETGENGRMTWTAERMLQVYFFGRLFCGDKAVYSKALDKYIWRQHKCIFPRQCPEASFRYITEQNATQTEESYRATELPVHRQSVCRLTLQEP